MRSLEGFVLPALVTLLLHATLIAVMTMKWQPERQPVLKPVPRHVKARIVTLEKASAPKPAAARPAPPAPKPKPPEPKPQVAKAEPKPAVKPQPKPQPKPKPDTRAQDEARQREAQRQRQQELALALAREEQAMQAETDAQLVMSYTDAIQAAIEDNWSRPPSARHDMEVILRIQLIPTGEVISVSIVKSSGNDAFDRSAINAVNKAGKFPEVAEAPPRVFERHLRSIQLVFHPEDLRL